MALIQNENVDMNVDKMNMLKHSVSVENHALDTSSWKSNAAFHQLQIFNQLSPLTTFRQLQSLTYDWDGYKRKERVHLKKKVSFTIFGIEEATEQQKKQPQEKQDLIENICKKIVEEGINGHPSQSDVYMAFIYVIWSKNDSDLHYWPVYKVPQNDGLSDALFIDINARVYKDWNDFLNNNKFPPCEYCFPKGGMYTIDKEGKLMLEFGLSPATKNSRKLVQFLDFTSAGLGLCTTVLSASSLILPVASPALQLSAWIARGIFAYSSVRSGTTLYDRRIHKQSVGLGNSESRSCWLTIGSSTLGVASSAATNVTQKVAQTGQVVGRIGCFTTNVLTFSNVFVSGLGIVHSYYELKEKHKRNQLSSLDVAQFAAAMLLFGHAVVNVKTARSIIESSQNQVFQAYENKLRSNRHRKIFRKLVRNTKGQQNSVEGNAKVIRNLVYVNNENDFFAALARMDKQFRKTSSKFTLSEGGFIKVNEQLSIDPKVLVEASPDDRFLLLEATKKYASNQMNQVEFSRLVEGFLGEIPSAPPNTSNNSPSLRDVLWLGKVEMLNVSQTEFMFSYPHLNAYQRMELRGLLKKLSECDYENILRMASVLFKALDWTDGEQYLDVVFFVCGFIRNVVNNSEYAGNEREKETNVGKNLCCMSTYEYCVRALKEFWKDSSKLVDIFKRVRELFSVLSTRNPVPKQLRRPSFIEICNVSSILLMIDEPLWLKCLTLSEKMASTFGQYQYARAIKIVKELCLYIIQTLKDMEQKHYKKIPNSPDKDELWDEFSVERMNSYCNTILDTVSSDSEVQQSLLEEIRKSNESNDLKFQTIPKYTRQQPLVLNRKFWNGNELTLLSEKEIIDVCKLALEQDSISMNCHIEFDGCDVFVNVDDFLVTIKCIIDEDQISVFVNRAVTL